MKFKLSFMLQTLLVIVYLAVIPLLYSKNTGIFHGYKILTLYGVFGLVFIVTILFNGDFTEQLKLSFKTFKLERKLMIIAALFMFISLFSNIAVMKAYVRLNYVGTPVFFGAGPNYLSIFFYWGCMLLFLALLPVWHYIKRDWVKYATITSLIITGLLITYQVFIYDFIEESRTFLFGFGNSNHAPDPFAIIGLALIIPFLFSKKIKWVEFIIGIFFFFVVLLTLSRAAFVGLVVSMVFSFVYLGVTKRLEIKRTLILVLGGLAVLTISILVLKQIGDTGIIADLQSFLSFLTGERSIASVSSSRTEAWVATFDEMNLNPIIWLFGNGQSVFVWETDVNVALITNVHNMYLDILFSAGIFVFVIFIVLLVKQFIYALKLAKYDVKNVVLLSAITFILVKWMFNSLNAVHSPFIIMVFIINSYRYMEYKKTEEVS